MLILYLLEDEQGLRVGVLLTLYIDEIIASFYIVFHWIWALTMSFTNIYHRLLWILPHCLGNLLYVIFTGFWPISHEIHHNWWQVRKDLRDVILWRRWQEKGLVNSWAVAVLIKAFLNQKLHRDIKSYKFMEEFMEKIFPIYQKLEGLVQPRRILKILEP